MRRRDLSPLAHPFGSKRGSVFVPMSLPQLWTDLSPKISPILGRQQSKTGAETHLRSAIRFHRQIYSVIRREVSAPIGTLIPWID
jgi:hypothetical protein